MEIKMVQCPNGHYYNAAMHSVCPECGQRAGGGIGATMGVGTGGGIGATVGVGGVSNIGATAGVGSASNIGATVGVGGVASGAGYQNNTIPVTPRNENPSVDGYEPTIIGGDSFDHASTAEPVVGWLVCVEGPMKGTDYRIHAGYNYIGREVGDIHIHGDNQISRQNHAMIAYDSGDHTYYFGPSGGRNLIKVNGKTILNAVEVKNYDVFTIGTSRMMFVGLCGPHFDWNEGRSND